MKSKASTEKTQIYLGSALRGLCPVPLQNPARAFTSTKNPGTPDYFLSRDSLSNLIFHSPEDSHLVVLIRCWVVRTPPTPPCGLDNPQIHEDILLSHTYIFYFIESLFCFLESSETSGVFWRGLPASGRLLPT